MCSDLEENREVLQNDGIYFQPNDVDDLLEHLVWANRHPELVAALARRARDRVGAQYSCDSVASCYVELYREALNDGRGKQAG